MEITRPKSAAPDRLRYFFDRENVLSFFMLMPAVVYIALLVGVPFILAILFAFTDATVGNPALHFTGLETFGRVLSDQNFQRALLNNFVFTLVSQGLMLILANILALVLSMNFRGKWFVRFLILLPWATPIALGTVGWLWMLDSVYSPIDYLMRSMGLLGKAGSLFGTSRNMYWLGPQWAALSVILVHVWRMLPMSTVIIMAGLSSIPTDIRDAAAVDGATLRREVFEITLPLIRPIIAVAFLFGIIFTFTDMIVIQVLTRGTNYTHVLASWAFFKGIEGSNLAEGAATAVFLLPVLIGVAILFLRLARRTEVA